MFQSQQVVQVAMPVVCDVCGTLNRHNAMFCLGCASRLPAFAPSGPSALQALETQHRAMDSGPARPARAGPAALPAESPGLWIRLGLVMLAMSIAFVAWYVYVTRKVSQPAPAAQMAAAFVPGVASPRAGMPADTETPAAQATSTLAPVEPVPVTPSVPVRPVRAPARAQDAPGPPVASGPASAAPTPAPRPKTPTRVAGARDPVRACADLDFISMARCQSAQCQTAEYRWHPRCEAVREEQQQITEARRRLALGY